MEVFNPLKKNKTKSIVLSALNRYAVLEQESDNATDTDFEMDFRNLHRIETEIAQLIDARYSSRFKVLTLRDKYFENMPISLVMDAICKSNYFYQIEHLLMHGNGMIGDFEWNSLPPMLQTLRIDDNDLQTKIQWEILPPNLRTMYVSLDVASNSLSDRPRHWQSWDDYQKYRTDDNETVRVVCGNALFTRSTFEWSDRWEVSQMRV